MITHLSAQVRSSRSKSSAAASVPLGNNIVKETRGMSLKKG